jgi:ABC-type lipoprotein release transport system permease subunit
VLVLAGRALEGMLFGVRSIDPVTIAAVAVILGSVALVAAWAPASRASKVDPIRALRTE